MLMLLSVGLETSNPGISETNGEAVFVLVLLPLNGFWGCHEYCTVQFNKTQRFVLQLKQVNYSQFIVFVI